MKALFLAVILALCATSAYATDVPKTQPPAARPADNWGGAKSHLAVSTAFGVACATHVFPGEPVKAFGCAIVPGLVKETIDSTQRGNRFSGRDMLANAVGAAAGVYLGGVMLRRSNGTTQIAYSTTF